MFPLLFTHNLSVLTKQTLPLQCDFFLLSCFTGELNFKDFIKENTISYFSVSFFFLYSNP